ncbi:prephenate dehydrogenase/arogenate dehydrogenase family protein [Pelagibacteraceae bacterium]|jgi:cyclohexadieny/prephenate dehydrogenase|nr:prephenate dehydrogenase/arogenate dehydrogenase family protein [Pelagibacteraceae bacterium]MDB9742986.1 prephenate dehydrogenase/arogenate dehydrogenase family protein [Pelagibacteraceae bacterium]MDC0339496.1 prephenate dehydrogenase/arogenate dehydrogenase family protein [Pelagibacteraceae bacterium]MDC0366136.1 prephenate dehydrogenase/arogenate dehydrogenase family protein [Pelagibacteraceae bacterium]
MFDKICILGCGLIGSSLLRAIHKKKLANKLSAFDKSKDVSLYLAKNFSFHIAKSIEEAVKDSDLVIISSPLSSYKEILLLIKSSLKKNVILTDTGSAKKEINKIINNLNLSDVNWIASHPIAGTEFSGPEAGFAELFEKRWCILSADKNISEKEIQKLKKFWIELGSKVKLMSFEQHDYVLSLTSHLPHAVAYSIVKTAVNDNEKFKNDIIQYSAGGLRDFTRIAASDPLMWRDTFIDNSENILKVLDNYSKNLDEIKIAIKKKDGEKLMKIFSSTKKVRKEIIKAGQDTDKPGFGRK